MIIHLQPVVGSFAENKEKAKELRVNKNYANPSSAKKSHIRFQRR